MRIQRSLEGDSVNFSVDPWAIASVRIWREPTPKPFDFDPVLTARITILKVDPPRQCKGLGRKLVEACLHEARVRRCECVYVECCPFDTGIPFTKLLEFYKSFGFKVVDVTTSTSYTLRLALN
jgi:GNAT superfamily N-acetyltransferase